MTRIDDCTECDATGRVRGCFGGGPYPCDDCGGLGWREEEILCLGCDEPVDERGFCRSCEGLTETISDPFQQRDAA